MTETEDKIMKLVTPLMPVGAAVETDTPLWHKQVGFFSGDAERGDAMEECLDSLDRVELAMGVEDLFNIEISDADTTDYGKFGTVGAIAAFVDSKTGAGKP